MGQYIMYLHIRTITQQQQHYKILDFGKLIFCVH